MSANAINTEYDSVKLMYVEMVRMRETYDLEMKNIRRDVMDLKMENIRLNRQININSSVNKQSFKFDSVSLRELWKEVTALRTALHDLS